MKRILIAVCLFVTSSLNHANTSFSFDSSATSWVGQGESISVTPEDGYLFTQTTNFDNGLSFRIASPNSPFGPSFNSSDRDYNYWSLDLAAPYNALLEVGLYSDTARFPFQAEDQPGLTLSGNHRGNNRNGGFFEILEIIFDANNVLSSFAVDFTQYGEEQESRWITGKLRYNSSVSAKSVPEIDISAAPISVLVLACLLCLAVERRKRV